MDATADSTEQHYAIAANDDGLINIQVNKHCSYPHPNDVESSIQSEAAHSMNEVKEEEGLAHKSRLI